MKLNKLAVMSPWIIAAAMTFTGCTNDDDPFEKAEIDVETLRTGISVTLTDRIGVVSVPLVYGFDEYADRDMIVEQLASSVSLTVSNNATGVSADIASGTLAPGEELPDQPDEFQWTLPVGHSSSTISLTFYNQTSSGLSMQVGGNYSALISVSNNDYLEPILPLSIAVGVARGN